MVNKKSARRNLTGPEMLFATCVAFEREAQRVSRQFLRSLSVSTEKYDSKK